MILLTDTSFKTIQSKTEEKLKALGISVSPGAIAKLFSAVINENIADFFTILKAEHVQAFVSTSTGTFLEAIGKLVNCSRKADEEDDNYRYRITNQILSTATANQTAIRIALLGIDGINDIVMKNCAFGPGSFSVIVLGDKEFTSTELAVMKESIAEVVGYGINYTLESYDKVDVKLDIKLIVKDGITEVQYNNLIDAVKENIYTYFDDITIGGTFIINELTQRIMETSDKVITYTCSDFYVNNIRSYFIDQSCNWNQKFVASSENDAISIA